MEGMAKLNPKVAVVIFQGTKDHVAVGGWNNSKDNEYAGKANRALVHFAKIRQEETSADLAQNLGYVAVKDWAVAAKHVTLKTDKEALKDWSAKVKDVLTSVGRTSWKKFLVGKVVKVTKQVGWWSPFSTRSPAARGREQIMLCHSASYYGRGRCAVSVLSFLHSSPDYYNERCYHDSS